MRPICPISRALPCINMKLLLFLLSCCIAESAFKCKEETIFGLTTYVSCPRPYNKPSEIYCCGSEKSVVCCDNPFNYDLDKIEEHLPAILGTIVAVAVSLIILCIVCCCCCPFCLLYKRRNRGVVHNPPGATTTTYVTYPSGPNVTQMQTQPNYAPVQTAPFANQPYPQPGYAPPPQGYGMPPQPPYPPNPGNTAYPTSQLPYQTGVQNPQGDLPPPYAEKQLPYNPNY